MYITQCTLPSTGNIRLENTQPLLYRNLSSFGVCAKSLGNGETQLYQQIEYNKCYHTRGISQIVHWVLPWSYRRKDKEAIHLTWRSLGGSSGEEIVKTGLFSRLRRRSLNEGMKAWRYETYGEASLERKRGKGWWEETMAGEETGNSD